MLRTWTARLKQKAREGETEGKWKENGNSKTVKYLSEGRRSNDGY
jgi:hypothetical protein